MTNTERAVQEVMQQLFRRHPSLCGFTVQKRAHRFCLSELAVHPLQYQDLSALLEGEIATAIADLLDDRPDAAGLLSGRTFARSLH